MELIIIIIKNIYECNIVYGMGAARSGVIIIIVLYIYIHTHTHIRTHVVML